MPPRESGSLEVTLPREFIVHDGFPMAFRGALLRGTLAERGTSLALVPLPCGAGGQVESGEAATEEVAEPSPPSDPPMGGWTCLTLSVGCRASFWHSALAFKSLSSSGSYDPE